LQVAIGTGQELEQLEQLEGNRDMHKAINASSRYAAVVAAVVTILLCLRIRIRIRISGKSVINCFCIKMPGRKLKKN